MPIIEPRRMLSELTVRHVMRRITASVPADSTLDQAVRCQIKYKVNAVLAMERDLDPVGVVSKTNIMGAYYAGVAISSPVRMIMTTPPEYCSPEDTLDHALNLMRDKGVPRLYVPGETPCHGTGVLSYPDVVGLLYRFCRRCERNVLQKHSEFHEKIRVREVMNRLVLTEAATSTLTQIMEKLSAHRYSALLITGQGGEPVGVISKTDLVLAFMHGVPTHEHAGAIMGVPVRSCEQETELAQAIRQMIFCDVQRIFVYSQSPDKIVGVLSLSDAAQARSGSCRACMPTRIEAL